MTIALAALAGTLVAGASDRAGGGRAARVAGLAASERHRAALVAEGERWWTGSPDPRNPVACATCHHDPDETRGWAAGFPRFRPLPPPHARVMTLVQAVAEAVGRHYRVADPHPAATAIAAYLTAHGAGAPVTPGVSPGQPAFPHRLRALDRAVSAGRRLFDDGCATCHRAAVVAARAATFPRATEAGGESLEGFLERHAVPAGALPWDGEATARLVAYLVAHRAGQPVHPGWRGTHIGPERAYDASHP